MQKPIADQTFSLDILVLLMNKWLGNARSVKSLLFAKPRLETMSEFDTLDKPLLTEKDEEYQMLIEVSDEYLEQKNEKTPQNKCGKATEIVHRDHLKGFNVTLNPNVKIQGSIIKNDLLLLKEPKTNPNQKDYPSNEVDMVIEIKNNAVANQSRIIKDKFDKLEALFPNLRFGVVILSERKGYTHEITNEKLGNKYPSFTFVSRRIYPKIGGLYLKSNIVEMLRKKEMKKTGEWEKFLSYLRQK